MGEPERRIAVDRCHAPACLTCDQATNYRPVQIEINGIGGVGPFPDKLS